MFGYSTMVFILGFNLWRVLMCNKDICVLFTCQSYSKFGRLYKYKHSLNRHTFNVDSIVYSVDWTYCLSLLQTMGDRQPSTTRERPWPPLLPPALHGPEILSHRRSKFNEPNSFSTLPQTEGKNPIFPGCKSFRFPE
jgi:hypothetical protein